ncbi:MAG: hypothetical protein WBD07_14490 [Vicinamibacterales bacterium]
MTRRLAGIAAIWVLICAGLAAADFWETKPFLMWSDKEVDTMITDSPWAQKVNVVIQQGPAVPSGNGPLRGEGGATEGGGRGGGGRAGGGDGNPQQLKLTVTWRSSLPVKEAVVRGSVGLGGVVNTPTQAVLDQKESFYVVTISGVPTRYSRQAGGLKDVTVLKRDKKPDIAVGDVRVEMDQGNLLLGFFFPRTGAITLDDKEVEVFTKLGELEIKKKFKLKDMVFHGQLEL